MTVKTVEEHWTKGEDETGTVWENFDGDYWGIISAVDGKFYATCGHSPCRSGQWDTETEIGPFDTLLEAMEQALGRDS